MYMELIKLVSLPVIALGAIVGADVSALSGNNAGMQNNLFSNRN